MEDKIIASWRNQKAQSEKSLSERNYDNFNCLPSEPLSYPRQSLQVGEPAQRAASQFQAFLSRLCKTTLLTPGNVDDRHPIPDLLQNLFGKFFADRGYVSQKLANQLLEDFGIQFFAKPRRNMRSRHGRVSRPSAIDLLKNKLMGLHDKLLSRQRSIIETINDQLKNISQIEHSRH